jgi:hypothetical protein
LWPDRYSLGALSLPVAKSPETFDSFCFLLLLLVVQIGLVASQKIPQYFDGTDNHTGGLMLVNDGKGANCKKSGLPNVRKLYQKVETFNGRN